MPGQRSNRSNYVPPPPPPAYGIGRILLGVAVVILALWMLAWCVAQSRARDNGQYSSVDPATRAWVKSLTDQDGNGCCDTADGFPAEVDWDTESGQYRVRIDGIWYAVPDKAIITKPNRLGYAVVWYYPEYKDGVPTPHIRCFIAGAGG